MHTQVKKRADSVRGVLGHRPPTQQRGHRTLERILQAAEDLLKSRRWDEITVSELVRRAGTTSGSLYARFASKDGILPYLYERYNQQVLDEIAAEARDDPPPPGSITVAVRALVDLASRFTRRWPWLMRAMATFARTRSRDLPASVRTRNREAYAVGRRLLAPFADRIARPDPERASAFALFVAATVARERIAFPDAPLAASLDMTEAEFMEELEAMVAGYLTHSSGSR